MADEFIESSYTKKKHALERQLRPDNLHEFIGQKRVQQQLQILIKAAKIRNDAMPHCLLSGPPGLGKTTLAHIISKSIGTNLIITSGPVLEKPGDLAGVLTNLQTGSRCL